MGSRRGNTSLNIDRFTKDLMSPSPRSSPPTRRKANGSIVANGSAAVNGFDRVRGLEGRRKGVME